MAESGKRPVCLGWDACVLLLFVGSTILLGRQDIDYWSGLTNLAIEKSLPFGSLFIFMLTIVFLPLCCIAAMVSLLVPQWKDIPRWGNAARCGVIALMCASLAGVWALREPGIYPFARGFEQRMRATADVKAIRAWVSALVLPAAASSIQEVDKSLWPECVTALSPRCVFIEKASGSGVSLHWGGGFMGDYGLWVGPEDEAAPRSNERILRVPIQRGAYLFFDRR